LIPTSTPTPARLTQQDRAQRRVKLDRRDQHHREVAAAVGHLGGHEPDRRQRQPPAQLELDDAGALFVLGVVEEESLAGHAPGVDQDADAAGVPEADIAQVELGPATAALRIKRSAAASRG
jgi:hypothetical protein